MDSFDDAETLWYSILGQNQEKRTDWYDETLKYWEQVPATVDGMLGGFEKISVKDLEFSGSFLKQIKNLSTPCDFISVLDCAAGIGRVTGGCLLKHFEKAEILEPIERFILKAKETLDSSRITGFYCQSLQDFHPKNNFYDCVWIQWCLCYFTDNDFVSILKRFKDSLKKRGIICIKDNVLLNQTFLLDELDKGVTRSQENLESLISEAQYEIVIKQQQKDFPKILQPIFIYCLRPILN